MSGKDELRAPVLVAVGLALWTVVTTVAGVVAASCDLPYADEWDTWMTWLKSGYSAGWFLQLHNDHRVTTTRLVFALDNWLFHGSIWFFQVASLVVQGLLCVLLWRLARRVCEDRKDAVLLGAAAVCCLFSAQQSINFIWGFQVQFFLVYATGAAALYALLRGWLSLSLVLAVASTYSMANGVLIWPILLAAAIWLQISRVRLAILAVAGAVAVGYYFHGWQSSPLDAPAPVWRMALFALSHAGAPIGPLLRMLGAGAAMTGITTAAAGAVVLGAAVLTWVGIWTGRKETSGGRMVLASIAVFAGAASAAVASGRAHLAVSEAFRSRYLTPPYILWACLLMLAWPRVGAKNIRVWRWAVAVALLAGIAQFQVAKLLDAQGLGAQLRQASVALAARVNDADVWPYLLRPATDSAQATEYLREHRMAFFAAEWTQWPGMWLSSRFVVGPESACRGSIDSTEAVGDADRAGWRIGGKVDGDQIEDVVLAGEDGMIRGVGRAVAGQWSGYARHGTGQIDAYAVMKDGKTVCKLGSREVSGQ